MSIKPGIFPRQVHVPIVALTAHALTGDEERMLNGGADYYLTKPLNPSVLLSKIAEILGYGSPALQVG